eukprot:TRINITY_DN3521_c0_g1_i3.p1 TRINITY_DN3521_c0_g1~~TRINITY_DN3521_c0_g1_i3.p1  ORF type:complete len:195 (+),score=56.08 TRINITY_DN3521_c0_g1_i3:186-770(+)
MSGSFYDTSCMTYSPDGRIFQVEYAGKAVENTETIIGIKCKDGIILGSEKLLHSKLLVEDTNRRIHTVDNHIGMVVTGRVPDGRNIIARARSEAQQYKDLFGIPISGSIVSDRVGQYVHTYTLYHFYRPFGSSGIIGSWDIDGPQLFMFEPTGVCLGYVACAIGKGKQTARSELEKTDFKTMTCNQALFVAAKM